MSAVDIQPTAEFFHRVDDAIASASRAVEGLTHRRFNPVLATKTFDWPDGNRSYRIRFNQPDELISLSGIVSGGTTMLATDFDGYPTDGPPYSSLESPRASDTAYFQRGVNGSQGALALTGVWGYDIKEVSAATTSEALDTSEVGIDVGPNTIGVGSLLRVDSERMQVVGKEWADSTQTGTLAASNAGVSLTVVNGSLFTAGETLLIESERVRVIDIAGNILTVKRAVDGSVLDDHAASAIYAQRTLVVERGVYGTTLATHSTSADVQRFIYPPLISQLARGYAVVALLGEESGFARTVTRSETTSDRISYARSIQLLEQQVEARYARRGRVRAV